MYYNKMCEMECVNRTVIQFKYIYFLNICFKKVFLLKNEFLYLCCVSILTSFYYLFLLFFKDFSKRKVTAVFGKILLWDFFKLN